MRILPILFNTPMVQAILDGRKTQTRRVINTGDRKVLHAAMYYGSEIPKYGVELDNHGILVSKYQPGDILYVRETWFYETFLEDEAPDKSRRYVYKASEPDYPVSIGAGGTGWKPSIHMPKEAARIFLRVTDVGVQKIRAINGNDLKKEGIYFDNPMEAYCSFADLWDDTIKPADRARYGWDANPWVWVYTFERCEKPEGWI